MSYHIKPNGNPGRCGAVIKCPYGGGELRHFSSKEAARKSYEAQQERSLLSPEEKAARTNKLVEKRSQAIASTGALGAQRLLMDGWPILRANAKTFRFEVLERDYGKPDLKNEYVAFVAGDLLHGPRNAYKLAMLNFTKEYTPEARANLAYELYSRAPEYVDDIVTVKNPEGEVKHTLVRLHDGSYLDNRGQWTREELLKAWAIEEVSDSLVLDETPIYPERRDVSTSLMTLSLEDYLKDHGTKQPQS